MLVIPAIDIRAGNAVMLTQGKIEAEKIFSKDPVFIAKLMQAKGAKRLHVVDLDGAFQGTPKNMEIVKNIRASIQIPIQFGGGIRNLKAIDSLINSGIDYVILGTLAVYNPEILRKAVEIHGKKIVLALDVRDSKVAIAGWKETTTIDALELALKARDMGVEEIIYTDIKKDGMMEGPNLEGLELIAKKSKMKIIASGGVSSLKDVENVKALESKGVFGAIVGKALYTEDIKLEEAIKIAEKQ
ncbi:MAG: 1-(5-phosphoribosyl)-5-[(5-phosphoribosylamino)methylideneamino]imidazole-4-carboxamide isomerase [Elusimicrobiota bacterium]